MPHTALIIDDESDIRELIALSLDRIGLDTHTAGNLEDARNLLDVYKFDVCLTDMKLPDGNGVDFVKHVLSIHPNLPVAVITAHGNMDAAVEAMKNGAFDFVSKPVDLGLLRSLVEQAITIQSGSGSAHAVPEASSLESAPAGNPINKQPTEERLHPTTQFPVGHPHQTPHSLPEDLIGKERLIGQSEPMLALKKIILKVARTNAPVWITGESGTGKELIAQLIHDNGPRADSRFVAINCGAIPSELMESELFGHRKGSFTGAHSDHDGLFKRAEGGTLFLDEVAELPLHMQVKLLRAIQERKVRPVGSADEISINVRILSASNKDLATEVEQNRFRHDLYYRLNVICIRAPSLRHRGDDVITIARHILHAIAQSEGTSQCAVLTPEAEDQLSAYTFPGNVRELENILERATALTDAFQIDTVDLNLPLITNSDVSQTELATHIQAANDSDERELIVGMLTQTRWNRKVAAAKLGMSYRQLRYRIKQYGIDEDQTGTE